MENFYKDIIQQKLTVRDLMIKGFKQTFGISYDDYLSKAKQMKGVSEEIEILDNSIDYYKNKTEEATMKEETEVQNG